MEANQIPIFECLVNYYSLVSYINHEKIFSETVIIGHVLRKLEMR